MKRHLNTLYVTSQGAYLNKDGANVVVSVDGAERARVPIHTLGGLVGFGRVAHEPAAARASAPRRASRSPSSPSTASSSPGVEGPVSGNVLLRREQYRRTDDPDGCAAIVRSLVIGKALNQRAVIRRALRDHGERMEAPAAGALEIAERRLTDIARRAERPQSADALRGLEGEAANVYFGVFDALILRRGPRASASPAARAARPSTRSTRCSPSSTRSWPTTCARRSRPRASTRRSASCTATGRGGRASPSTSWRSSGRSSPTAWCSR